MIPKDITAQMIEETIAGDQFKNTKRKADVSHNMEHSLKFIGRMGLWPAKFIVLDARSPKCGNTKC